MAQPQLTVEWARLTVDWPQLQVQGPLVRPMGHFLKASAIIFAACVAAMSGAPTQTGTMDGIDALFTPGINQAILVFSQHSTAADLWSSVQFSNGIIPSWTQECNDSSVFPPVPQGYRSNFANAFSKLCSGDWSGFGIHLQMFTKSNDESNEHQVIEDQPETIAVFVVGMDWSGVNIHLQFFIKFTDELNEHQVIEDQLETTAVLIVGRSWSSSNWKREIRSQWKVGSLKSVLCSTSFLAILDFHVTSTSNCGPSCLVDNNDRRDSSSYFEACVWTFAGMLVQHWLQTLGMKRKRQDWLGSRTEEWTSLFFFGAQPSSHGDAGRVCRILSSP